MKRQQELWMSQRAGSITDIAGSKKGTADAEAGGDVGAAERTLGAKVGGAAAEGGRWRGTAPCPLPD